MSTLRTILAPLTGVWLLSLVMGVPPTSAATAGPDAARTENWVTRFNGAANKTDSANDVAVSPDGSRVFVTGKSFISATTTQFATLAYDASSGSQLWEAENPGTTSTTTAEAISVSPDGARVFVAGWGTGALTVAYDAATGAELWEVTNSDVGYLFDLAVSPDGGTVAVIGNRGYYAQMATIGYDAATGTELWEAFLQDGGFEPTTGERVTASPDGRAFYATGYAYNGNSEEWMTEALNAATGKKLWSIRYNSPHSGYDESYGIVASPDGSKVFVTGCSGGVYCSGSDYGTVAYDAHTGHKLWLRIYDSGGTDAPTAIGVTPDGSTVFVTGSTGSGTTEDYGTIAYNAATGTPLWFQTYNGPADDHDFANDLRVSVDGTRVYVTGGSQGSTHLDYATVAYDAATGAELWVDRYDGPIQGDDTANALAVGPLGNAVFVTGESAGFGTGKDYATLSLTS
jgi:WD40 repeat protein